MIPSVTVSVDCDLCGSSEHCLLFVKEGFRHVRCSACGLVFVSPRLRAHLAVQEESGTGTMGDERPTVRQRKRLLRELAEMERFRVLGRLIEVGPGRGWFLAEAARVGWQTCAVEVNATALNHLRGLGVDRIVAEPAERFSVEHGSADVVRIWDVIEHLESPRQAVANIHRVLRSGGLLRLATTNFASLSRCVNGPEWVYLNGADHIHLFEPATITRLLESQGFTAVRIGTRSFNLRRKLYHPECVLPLSAPLLRPFRKIIDEAIRFTRYGHQMIVTAVKP